MIDLLKCHNNLVPVVFQTLMIMSIILFHLNLMVRIRWILTDLGAIVLKPVYSYSLNSR